MKIAVLDTETTGIEPKDDSVLEVAVVELSDEEGQWKVNWGDWTYVRHAGPIPAEAKAVHHIQEEDVNRSTLPDLPTALLDLHLGRHEMLAAHNAPFDRSFLPALDAAPWICTYRCAMHIWPDAPRFSNQVLRYWLDIRPPLPMQIRNLAPHRALYDTAVTAGILLRMLETHDPATLLELSTQPVLLKTVGFGKHKGLLWKDVPWDYLRWILRNPDGMNPDVLHTARHWVDAR